MKCRGETGLQSDEVEKVAKEIESYLVSNPNAADSLNGITNWWIAKQRITENMDLVENAVERLVDSGVIRRNEDEPDNVIYSLNKN